MSIDKKKVFHHNIRTQVDGFGRKKYKLEEVEKSQEQQDEQKKDVIIDTGRHKSMLIGRQQSLNIQKYIGKIQTNKKKKRTQVFYCEICKEGFKCDMAYLSHINGSSHNRKLGMNMKVKSVSLECVSNKIKDLIRNKQQKSKGQELEGRLMEEMERGKEEGKNGKRYERQVRKDDGVESGDKRQDEQENKQQNEQEDVQNDEQDDEQDGENNGEVKAQFGDEVKQQEEQKEKQNEGQQEQEDEQANDQQQLMRQMGLPTSFGSKKQKR